MTRGPDIRLAGPGDAGAIADMLARLADDLGDGAAFSSTPETIQRHGFGPAASFSTILATNAGAPAGLALFFRHFSTTRGLPGVYVQDLWVAPDTRGQKLGARLLAAVASHAAREWDAGYLALTVHATNPAAARFYSRLGFSTDHGLAPMSLTGTYFRALAESEKAPA